MTPAHAYPPLWYSHLTIITYHGVMKLIWDYAYDCLAREVWASHSLAEHLKTSNLIIPKL